MTKEYDFQNIFIFFRRFYNVILSLSLGKPYLWIHSATFIQNSCLSHHFIPFWDGAHMGEGQCPALDEWLVHHTAL